MNRDLVIAESWSLQRFPHTSSMLSVRYPVSPLCTKSHSLQPPILSPRSDCLILPHYGDNCPLMFLRADREVPVPGITSAVILLLEDHRRHGTATPSSPYCWTSNKLFPGPLLPAFGSLFRFIRYTVQYAVRVFAKPYLSSSPGNNRAVERDAVHKHGVKSFTRTVLPWKSGYVHGLCMENDVQHLTHRPFPGGFLRSFLGGGLLLLERTVEVGDRAMICMSLCQYANVPWTGLGGKSAARKKW